MAAAAPTIVAHRGGNDVEAARRAVRRADMIELDVHVLRGTVEVRHAKVLHPTRRLWERWYLLPRAAAGVSIDVVLGAISGDVPLMVDVKCFLSGAARQIEASIPGTHPIVVSTRSWWLLSIFDRRPRTIQLRSCGNRWQRWLALRLPGRSGFCMHERLLTTEVLATLARAGRPVYSWGVTTRARCDELSAAGVSGLILDDLTLVGR